jgi:hypothetical protein
VASTGHKQTSDRVEFCRVPDCDQTEYRGKCAAPWLNEAHHLLCVNYVNAAVSQTKPQVKKVIDESKWCINNKDNMVALPIWGTTVLHYCASFQSVASKTRSAVLQAIAQGLKSTDTKEPLFKNLPQHNYGHAGRTSDQSYNLEIEEKLEDWVVKIEFDIQKHSATGDKVQDQLNTMSGEMRGELKKRGERVGSANGNPGTHNAWLYPADDKWYLPFSMAKNPKPMPQPKMGNKIVAIAEALWRS